MFPFRQLNTKDGGDKKQKLSMITTEIFIILFILNVINGETCPSVTDYYKMASNKLQRRLTTITDGNYTIQAIFTLTKGTMCDQVSKDGVVRSFTMKFAIDKINKAQEFSIGLHIDDDCRNLPVTMARGVEVISLHRPNSVCRANFVKCKPGKLINQTTSKPAIAIMGTGMSFTTMPLANLMSLYDIPIISPGASNSGLSRKDLYKSFFRTIPSDTYQVKAMLDIIEKFKWNYIFAIGSDDEYGRKAIADLKTRAKSQKVCIAGEQYIQFQGLDIEKKIAEVVAKVDSVGKAKVVVLFCLLEGLGDKILMEAKKKRIQRIWLTSEAWYPDAEVKLDKSLRNESVGMLTVALRSYPMKYLIDYMYNEVITNFKCNMWLLEYLKNEFKCKPDTLSNNKTTFYGENCTISVSKIMENLSVLPGRTDLLLDATSTLVHGIHRAIKRKCKETNGTCSVPKISPKYLTDEIFKLSFTNEQGKEISFDSSGDPKDSFYKIENLQWINGSMKYASVGYWKKGYGLKLQEDKITWPHWVDSSSRDKVTNFPKSRCTDECVPGEYVATEKDCCWQCKKCFKETYTDKRMSSRCKNCPKEHHANEGHTGCIKTPVQWLTISNPIGTTIIMLSGIGLILIGLASAILFKFRCVVITEISAPHLVTLSCILLAVTFSYGPLHLTKPDKYSCGVRNALFFLLIMMYSAILFAQSNLITKSLRKHADKSFKGSLFIVQALFLLVFFLLELSSAVVWMQIDKDPFILIPATNKKENWLECPIEFTGSRLVCTFIPCIFLIIATFTAFRERNTEHPFYEPKFLSFTCIAFCIIVVAFNTTYNYVRDTYKANLMAFTIDVFGYTYLSCLILPKVYVLIRYGSVERKSVADTKVEKNNISLEPTESSIMETSLRKENHCESDVSRLNSETVDDFTTENGQGDNDGYVNEVYEQMEEYEFHDKDGKVKTNIQNETKNTRL